MVDKLNIVCPHCDAINRVPRERLRERQVRVLPSAAVRKAAGCVERRRSLRQACQSQRHSAARRFLGSLVRPLPGDGADLRTGGSRARFIQSIPTLMLVHHGREIARKSGVMPLPQLLAWAREHADGVKA
jgi:thioredoxin 2